MNYQLNILGVRVLLESESSAAIASLKSDYGYFETRSETFGNSYDWKISIYRRFPEPRSRWLPAFFTVRSTVYWSPPGIRRVKFFKKCLVECDFNRKRADLYFDDEIAGYESLYFVLESILSSELDERGLHRLHAFAASLEGRSVVVLGKSGAGKSTLFANWFADPAIKFLGDDMVVTDEKMLCSYPAKISFKEMPTAFPQSEIREFFRQQYGLRFLLDSRTMKSRFEADVPWGKLVLLQRTRAVEKAELRSVGRWRVFGWLVRWLVVGLETPQIAELFLPVSPRAVVRKIGHLISRFRRAWRISREVPGYIFLAPEGPARMASFLKESLVAT